MYLICVPIKFNEIMRVLFAAIVLLFFASCTEKKQSVEKIEYSVQKGLSDFKACRSVNKKTDCQDITAKALCGHFEITDFVHLNEKGESYFTAVHQIAAELEKHEKWVRIGTCEDRAVMEKALKHVDAGVPAVGLSRGEGTRHVAILLKGEANSGKWGGRVPVCASYFQNNPKGSFIDKGMNYAWSDPSKVEIWVRL